MYGRDNNISKYEAYNTITNRLALKIEESFKLKIVVM